MLSENEVNLFHTVTGNEDCCLPYINAAQNVKLHLKSIEFILAFVILGNVTSCSQINVTPI